MPSESQVGRDGEHDGMDYSELVEAADMSESDVARTVETLYKDGEIMKPETDHYRVV